MPFRPKFLRRKHESSCSSQQDSASADDDYHRYTDQDIEINDAQQTAVNTALHALNEVNDGTIESSDKQIENVRPGISTQKNENEVVKDIVGHENNYKQKHNESDHIGNSNTNENTDDDSSAAWWNLLSNKGSFDTTSVAVSTPIKEPLRSMAAADYIQKEKMLRKKAFNRAVLGGSVRFDNTFSDESITSLSYREVHSVTSWGMGAPSKQDDIPIQWTPQDSSYGAAVSAFGWLPKRIRKMAEAVIVVLAIAILVYLVVKIGAEINRNHSSASSGGGLDLDDDDHYIAHDYNGAEQGGERLRFI